MFETRSRTICKKDVFDKIADIIELIAMESETMDGGELGSLQKIFCEMEAMQQEVKEADSSDIVQELYSKVECVEIILNMNSLRDNERVFAKWSSMYKVIHEVNTGWAELRRRGFSRGVYLDFRSILMENQRTGSHMEEAKKLKMFMEFIAGNMKFCLQYTKGKPAEYKLIPVDVKVSNIGFSKWYALQAR